MHSFIGLTKLDYLKAWVSLGSRIFPKPNIGPFTDSSDSKPHCSQTLNHGGIEPSWHQWSWGTKRRRRLHRGISIFLFHRLTHSLQNLLPKGSAVYALFGSLENFGTSIANIVYRVLFFFNLNSYIFKILSCSGENLTLLNWTRLCRI